MGGFLKSWLILSPEQPSTSEVATYGFPEITTLGRKGESRCDEVLERGDGSEVEDIEFLRRCLSGISSELGREEDSLDDSPEVVEFYLMYSDRTGLSLQMELLEACSETVDVSGDLEETGELLLSKSYGAILVDDRDRSTSVRRIARMRQNSSLQYKTPLIVVSEDVGGYSQYVRLELAQLGVDQILSAETTLPILKAEIARIRGGRRSDRGVVMLAESDASVFEAMKTMLASRQILTVQAKTQDELADRWFERAPDILVYQQRAGETRATEFFQALKGNSVLKAVDIVLLVSDYELKMRDHIFHQGVDDFLQLPLHEAEVLGRLLPRLELKRAIRTRGRHQEASIVEASHASQHKTTGPAVDGRRVILADDDPPIRGLLAFHLERAGWQVTSVEDGRQAVDQLAEETFDLAVLDVNMPMMSGFEVLDWLKAHPQRRPAKVVMLTAMSYEASVQRAFELGVDEFLSKPFDPLVAITRINRVMR